MSFLVSCVKGCRLNYEYGEDRVFSASYCKLNAHCWSNCLHLQGGFAKMSDVGAKMPNLGQKRLFEVILGSFEVT